MPRKWHLTASFSDLRSGSNVADLNYRFSVLSDVLIEQVGFSGICVVQITTVAYHYRRKENDEPKILDNRNRSGGCTASGLNAASAVKKADLERSGHGG